MVKKKMKNSKNSDEKADRKLIASMLKKEDSKEKKIKKKK